MDVALRDVELGVTCKQAHSLDAGSAADERCAEEVVTQGVERRLAHVQLLLEALERAKDPLTSWSADRRPQAGR